MFVLVVQAVAFPLWVLFFNVPPSGALVLLAGVAVRTAYRDPSSRRFFLATILIGVLDLIFFALAGMRL